MDITLIGMSGAGKSVVGKALANLLGYAFVDIDEEMEARMKLPLAEIVKQKGDEAFVRFEAQTFQECLRTTIPTVFAPGGSVVYSGSLLASLKERSTIVYLYVTLETLRARNVDFPSRGVVGLSSKNITALFEERKRLCERYADVTFKTNEATSPALLAETIAAWVRAQG